MESVSPGFAELDIAIDELWQTADAGSVGLAKDELARVLLDIGSKYNYGLAPGNTATRAHVLSFWRSLQLPDLALAHACALGRDAAWDRFMAVYREPLTQAAIGITGSAALGHELADSLYSEMFGLTEREGKRRSPLAYYSGRGSFKGFLRATLAQRHVDYHRRASREAPLPAGDLAAAPAVPPPPPAVLLRLAESLSALLSGLEAEERLLLSSWFLDRRTLLEISRMLRVHEATVSRRIGRLTERLHKELLARLQASGMSLDAAQEALGTDPRDININLRSVLQDSTSRCVPGTEGARGARAYMSEHLPPGLHPDPDSLNAFMEGVLPEHERLECTAHLAECAQCREVVYLAQEGLPAPVADKVPFWKRWFRPIPALSAAAVAAAVLALSIGIYRLEKLPAPAPVTMMSTPPPQALQEHAAEAPPVAKAIPAAPPRMAARASQAPATHAEPAADALSAAPAPVAALPANGSISVPSAIIGTVTDPAGGVIPRATVTVHPIDGASNFVASSDAAGQFHLDGIQPGKYEVRVVAPGFQSATKQVEVQKDQVARADSALSVGSVSASVDVTASAPALNTESAELSVAQKKSGLAAVPLVGRLAARKAASGPVSQLPSKLAAVTTVEQDKIMLAVDSAGALFVSQNSGQKWKPVKPAWQGNIAGLETSGTTFRLTTDSGAAWLSRDGTHWAAKKK